jgi:hypothetical protein
MFKAGVNGMRESRKQRRKILIELARQSILKFAPKPITSQELHDCQWQRTINMLIATVKHARYHKPSQILTEINPTKLTSKALQTTIINIKSIGSS